MGFGEVMDFFALECSGGEGTVSEDWISGASGIELLNALRD